MSLEFDAEKHIYTIDGVVVPSVTEVLSILNDFSSVSPAALQQAARRGTLVHEYTQLIDYGMDANDIDIEPELVGYVQAWLQFEHDWQPQWELIEHKVHCGKQFAGTLDRLGIIAEKRTLVDIKSSTSPSVRTKIIWAGQLHGYYEALDERMKPSQIWDVLLKKDGSYSIIDGAESETKYGFRAWELWESALYIYNTLHRRKA